MTKSVGLLGYNWWFGVSWKEHLIGALIETRGGEKGKERGKVEGEEQGKMGENHRKREMKGVGKEGGKGREEWDWDIGDKVGVKDGVIKEEGVR